MMWKLRRILRADAGRAPRSWRAAALVLCGLIGVAGCENTHQPPLLSPLASVRAYGYADQDLGGDRVAVTFLGPRNRITANYPDIPEAAQQAARTEAQDLATWRAAQLCGARGCAGFHIQDSQVSYDAYPESIDAAPPSGTGGGGSSWGAGQPPGYYFAPRVYVQARVTLTVALHRTAQPGDENPQAVIERLRPLYPDAEAVKQAGAS